MWRYAKKLNSIEDLIISDRAAGFSIDRKKNKPENLTGMKLYRALASGLISREPATHLVFKNVRCKEHDRMELVSNENYFYDLQSWYRVGDHPRFSIVGALIQAGQHFREIRAFLGPEWFFWRQEEMFRRNQTALLAALKGSKTPEEFIKRLRPHLFTTLKLGGRRPRVPFQLKEKYEAKAFTVEEFFDEPNHEYRRIMLRIVPIKKVLERLKLVCEDSEGKLYDLVSVNRNMGNERTRYLYVKCPSTGQEYLLQVPENVRTPKEARRWTFRLEEKDVFAAEA